MQDSAVNHISPVDPVNELLDERDEGRVKEEDRLSLLERADPLRST